MPYKVAVNQNEADIFGITPDHIERLCSGRIIETDSSVPGMTFHKMIGLVPNGLPNFLEVIEVMQITNERD